MVVRDVRERHGDARGVDEPTRSNNHDSNESHNTGHADGRNLDSPWTGSESEHRGKPVEVDVGVQQENETQAPQPQEPQD